MSCELPVTGTEAGTLLAIGALTLLFGAAVLVVRRRAAGVLPVLLLSVIGVALVQPGPAEAQAEAPAPCVEPGSPNSSGPAEAVAATSSTTAVEPSTSTSGPGTSTTSTSTTESTTTTTVPQGPSVGLTYAPTGSFGFCNLVVALANFPPSSSASLAVDYRSEPLGPHPLAPWTFTVPVDASGSATFTPFSYTSSTSEAATFQATADGVSSEWLQVSC